MSHSKKHPTTMLAAMCFTRPAAETARRLASPGVFSKPRRAVMALALLAGLMGANLMQAQTVARPIAALQEDINGVAPLTDAQIKAQAGALKAGIVELSTNVAAMKMAFNLVKTYDTKAGALFTTPTTKQGFKRNGAGFELAQAMFDLQQGILDYVYTPANLAAHAGLLDGEKFETAAYFPGDVNPPADPTTGYAVPINASLPVTWGSPAMYETDPVRRPTGCYLAPGSIACVTVPEALVNHGFAIRVGAQSWDLKAKKTVKRLDRISLVYPITSATTRIANPLGGGIYIEVPYKANFGIVTVGITNVVRSPFFSATSFHHTTLDEWLNTERKQPGPWADFESDKFMMQVPRSWIYNFTNPVALMRSWDQAMDVVSDLMGRPCVRSKTVLYIQPDVLYRGTANFPGYPQSNFPYNPNARENGDKNIFFLTGPKHAAWTVLHELGHAQQMTKFTGETESLVNFLDVAVLNQEFGVPLEEAFGRSIGDEKNKDVSLTQAALTWMLTDRFRAGEAMTDQNMKYQHRGYAKYVEIVNLFGWGALSNFWHSVSVDYMNGISYPINTDPTDSRILRMSQAAGVDLRPLIHFWGVHPVDPVALKKSIEEAGLRPSLAIYDRLKHYQTAVPTNQMQFDAHYKIVKNAVGNTVDGNWYKQMENHYPPEIGQASVRAVQNIIDLYFPDGSPESAGRSAWKASLGGTAP